MSISRIVLLVVSVYFFYIISGCKTTIVCSSPSIVEVDIASQDSSLYIDDTTALITAYAKGSNFSTVTDSFPATWLGSDPSYHKSVSLTGLISNIYNNDWRIVLLPSMKTYSITNLSHDNRTLETKANQGSFQCYDNIVYSVNGAPAVSAASNSSLTASGLTILTVAY